MRRPRVARKGGLASNLRISARRGAQGRRAAALRRAPVHAVDGLRRLRRRCGARAAPRRQGLDGVVYEDANDPRGVAVLTLTRTPEPSWSVCGRRSTPGPAQSWCLSPNSRCWAERIRWATNQTCTKHYRAPHSDRSEPRLEMGDLVSASEERSVRAAAGR